LNKQIVYIEHQALEHPNTQIILKNLGFPKIITINHYKDLLNSSGSDWRMQKKVQKIVLALRTSQFFYSGSDITPSFGFDNYYYNTLALNCIYDCDYCYLQGLFNSPHLVLFVNNEDFINAFLVEYLSKPNQKHYLALSYDTDLLPLESFYPYTKQWINFAKEYPNIFIEIRTKSISIKPLLNIDPVPNVIIAFTLSPQAVIALHEPLTPPLSARLKCLKQVVERGYQVRVCIDPIIHIPNWEASYKELIKQLANTININRLNSISVGTFRMNAEFFKRIKKQRADTGIVFYPYQKTEDIMGYSSKIINKMYACIQNSLDGFGYIKDVQFQ
jgi:spore photoproduct lyase